MVNLQNIKVKANNSFQTVCPFPIGFVYSSMNSTSPASTFGGSWTEIKGRFPYFNAGTETGGSNSHSHSLSGTGFAQIASYNNELRYNRATNHSFTSTFRLYFPNGTEHGEMFSIPQATHLGGSAASGGGLPPYQTLYAWYRTA